jgi:predicted TIM-barrel fold metal-dependent hydrolase
MTEIIDVHSHLLNFKFIPDSFFRTRAPIREKLIRRRFLKPLYYIIAALPWLRRYKRLPQYLRLMNRDISEVAEDMIREMKDADIQLTIPLMMDLKAASFGEMAETPYAVQVTWLSEIALKYPGRIMPFIMFDPRREGAAELVKHALDKLGFLGIKMYPPLGYHPDPESIINNPDANAQLEEVYQHCNEQQVPITAHCSWGGAYGSAIMRHKESFPLFTSPNQWKRVVEKYPGLRLSFGHFGGHWLEPERSWLGEAIQLMEDHTNVFADVSYHHEGLEGHTSRAYAAILRDEVMANEKIRERVMFGTDWPMGRHTWTMKEYCNLYLYKYGDLDEPDIEALVHDNAMRFLFAGSFPQRLKDFYGDRFDAIPADEKPQWVRELLG